MTRRLLSRCLIVSSLLFSCHRELQPSQGHVLLDKEGLPFVFELNRGEHQRVARKTVQLVDYKPTFEPNYMLQGSMPKKIYTGGEVTIAIDGRQYTLLHRPFQMPATIEGLRLYVELLREMNETATTAKVAGNEKEVRFSVRPAGQPWFRESVVFPIRDYRWRSASYNNTWTGWVPYTHLYYHRGEDYGAIPDRLGVVAPVSGKIVQTPWPDGDGRSNGLVILNKDSIAFRMAHMNLEFLAPDLPAGSQVSQGQTLARTGETWSGRKSQHADPHFHIDLSSGEVALASYPVLVEAYQSTYADPVMAVAGGYRFVLAGDSLQLDGSRSLASRAIKSYRWETHDGAVRHAPSVWVRYAHPGVYSEVLTVQDGKGNVDVDFAQVMVFAADDSTKAVRHGWAYHAPVRHIKPGDEVLFWNRLVQTDGKVKIDFGDGQVTEDMGEAVVHTYRAPGLYIANLHAQSTQGYPVNVKLKVVVE